MGSSKTSLKGVLRHIVNIHSFMPVAYSVYRKETYGKLNMILQKIIFQLPIGWYIGIKKVVPRSKGHNKVSMFNMCVGQKTMAHKKNFYTCGENNILQATLVNPKQNSSTITK